MGRLITYDQIIEEIKLIPEHILPELYDFVHYFRLGLQKGKSKNKKQIMKFAGCWEDMSEEIFNEFLGEITQRRKQAFSGRRRGETCTD